MFCFGSKYINRGKFIPSCVHFLYDFHISIGILLFFAQLILAFFVIFHRCFQFFPALAHDLIVKGFCSDTEKCRIIGKRIINFEISNSECHHNIGYCMGFREHVLDLSTRLNVPVRHTGFFHSLLPLIPLRHFALCHQSFTNLFHNIKSRAIFHTGMDQVSHNIISGTDGRRQGTVTPGNIILGIIQPYIGSMGQTGNANQIRKVFRLGIPEHLHNKICTKFRNPKTSQVTSHQIIRRYSQCAGIRKQRQYHRIIQADGNGVYSGNILQHTDHGRIVVSQYIKFQQVVVNGVVVKMGSDNRCFHIIGRMLHRCKCVNIPAHRKYYDTSRVLAGSSPDSHTALQQSFNLYGPFMFPPLFKVIFYITIGGFVCQCSDSSCTECLSGSKDYLCITVGLTLVLT